jgi:glycosyltransferase involved in cell wall biosynthesis
MVGSSLRGGVWWLNRRCYRIVVPIRVLAITSELPWPLNTGGHLRTYHMLKALSRAGFEVAAAVPVAAHDADAGQALQAAGVGVQQVVVGARTRAGEARKALRATMASEPYAFYRRHHWPQVQAFVDQALARRAADVIYLDHLDSFAYVSGRLAPVAVLDMHNVYSTVLSRSMAEERNPAWRALLAIEAWRVRRVERRAVAAVDVTLAVSEPDARTFVGMGARQVATVPNGVDTAAFSHFAVGRPDTTAPVLLFVGALSWAPNEAACRCLVQRILPKVRVRFPRAEAHLVGRLPTRLVRDLGSSPGVKVFADVPDVGRHLAAASALVVPLTVGGGTRLKILEAFAAGLPVVSTAVGAEGIDCRHEQHLLLAEPDALADAVVRLITTPDLARRLALDAQRLAIATYDWAITGRAAADALEAAVRRRRTAA